MEQFYSRVSRVSKQRETLWLLIILPVSILFLISLALSTRSIESRMSQDGRIFSDGIEDDYLEFNAGVIVRIELSDQKEKLVV